MNVARQEGAVAFRLFADTSRPTLTVPEQIAARIGDRIISGALTQDWGTLSWTGILLAAILASPRLRFAAI